MIPNDLALDLAHQLIRERLAEAARDARAARAVSSRARTQHERNNPELRKQERWTPVWSSR